MSLLFLPTELKHLIIAFLVPESTLDFALTCKHHAEVCHKALGENAQLFAQWRILDIGRKRSSLWAATIEILSTPRIGWYVRELNLPSRHPSWKRKRGRDSSEGDNLLLDRATRSLRSLYPTDSTKLPVEDARRYPDLPRPHDLIHTIAQRIAAGSKDALISLLIHHLPYLRTIRLTDDGLACLRLTMQCIAAAHSDPMRANRLPLQCLAHASVAHDIPGTDYLDPDWACFFLRLPSLQTFVASHMGGAAHFGGRVDLMSPVVLSVSNVTELVFDRCRIHIEALDAILASITQLKSFTYTGGEDIDEDYRDFSPKRVIEILAYHSGATLRHLLLEDARGTVWLRSPETLIWY